MHQAGGPRRRQSGFYILGLFIAVVVLSGYAGAGLTAAPGGDDDGAAQPEVQPGVVVVKVRPQAQQQLSLQAAKTGIAALDQVSRRYGVYAVEPAFPTRAAGARKRADDLSRIYRFRYEGDADPRAVAADFARQPGVEYAEPLPIFRLHALPPGLTLEALRLAEPNDSLFNMMTHLDQVSLPEAWEIVRSEQGLNGDPGNRVIIAVADGGTDWRHEDLRPNVWTNPGETPGNGTDDDNNGYVDDVHGWNFANETPDPTGLPSTPSNAEHGTVVAGVAAAVANNVAGVAGSSWNAILMPINVSCENDGNVCFGYNGIMYAAENGAHIVNASWGGDGLSRLAQDVIDAALDLGTIVVTSAGNNSPFGTNNDIRPQSPASQDGVLAVGATQKSSDEKAGYSNYGRTVDVFAPGSNLNSTYPDDEYDNALSGTSFSSPLVAGIAALVKTHRPEWTMAQVREQLRVTADPIDAANPNFAGRLGLGRVNALRAVTEFDHAAIRVTGVHFDDADGNGAINRDEPIQLTLTFRNFLADASNVTFRLTTPDSEISLMQSEASVAQFPGGTERTVTFSFSIANDTPDEYTLRFFAEVSAGAYADVDYFQLPANPAVVLTHNAGLVQVSLTEQGNIGWVGSAGDPNPAGVGYVYRGTNYLFEGGLLVATDRAHVSDAVRNTEDGSGNEPIPQDHDFVPQTGSDLEIMQPGALAYEEGIVTLVDAAAPNPIGVIVEQQTFADTTTGRREFVIFKYSITNDAGADLTNLHAGLFFDWDINTDALDAGRYDADRRMGIAQDASFNPNVLLGTKLLTTNASVNYRTIDNEVEIYGGNAGNGFTESEKWNFLSGGIQQPSVSGADISTLLSAGPIGLKPACSFDVAFAVIGGTSEAALQANADAAQAYWNDVLSTIEPNQPPAFTTPGGLQLAVAEGQTLTHTFEAADPDACDVLAFALDDDAPANAAIDSRTGVLTFTPAFDQAGVHTFGVAVTDGQDREVVEVVVTVTNANRPPAAFSAALPDTLITAAQTLRYEFAVTDPDGDAITYRLVDPPANASIDAASGAFTFTPASDQLGAFTMTVEGTDGEDIVSTSATVTVVTPTFEVAGAYPSPFSPAEQARMTFAFQLPAQSTVTLTIYDLLGRAVATLVDGDLPPGPREVQWDGRSDAGHPLASGIYFYRLTARTGTQMFDEHASIVLVR